MALKKTESQINVSSAANARNLKADKSFGNNALAYAEKEVKKTFDFFAQVKNEQAQAHYYSKFTVDLKKKFDEVDRDYPMDASSFKSITDKWIKAQLENTPKFLQAAMMQEGAKFQASYISNIMNLKWKHDDNETWNDSERALDIKLNSLDMAINAITSNPAIINEEPNVTLTKINSLVEQEIGLMVGPYEKTLNYMKLRGYENFTSLLNDARLKKVLIEVEKKRVAAIYEMMPDGEKMRYLNDYIDYQNGYQNERLEKKFGVNGNQSMTLNVYELTKDKNLRTDIIEYAQSLNAKYIVNKNNELTSKAESNNNSKVKKLAWDNQEVITLNSANAIHLALNAQIFNPNSENSVQDFFYNHESTKTIANAETFKIFKHNVNLVNDYLIPIIENKSFILPKDEDDKKFILKGIIDTLDIKSTSIEDTLASINDLTIENTEWGKLLNYTAKFNVLPDVLANRFRDLSHISPKNPEGIDEIKMNMGIYNYIKSINPSFDFKQIEGNEFYDWAYAKGIIRSGSNNEIAIAIEKFYGKDGVSYKKREEVLNDELNQGTTINLEPILGDKDKATQVRDGTFNVFDKILYNKLNSYNVKRDWVTESYLQISDAIYTWAGQLSDKEHIQKYWANRVKTFEEAPDGVKAILENGMFGTELSWIPFAGMVQGITPYVGQTYISEEKRQLILKEWKHQYLMISDSTTDINSKEGQKLASIAMDNAIATFANYEVNDTTYESNKFLTSDAKDISDKIIELKYDNLKLDKDSKEYKNNLTEINNLNEQTKNLKIKNNTWSLDISKIHDVNSKTSKTIMAYDAEHIITNLYHTNRAEYNEIFGNIEPKTVIRNRKFTNGIQVTIDENTPGADGKPAMKLLIRDADGDMYDLNELADSTNYRLFTSNFRLDKENLPFTYENLKEHRAIEQAETLIKNIKDFIPMSEGVENFTYETFKKLGNFAFTVGNWEATLPSISNLWTDDINEKTYSQFSFAKWKKQEMEAYNDENLKWWGISLNDNDSLTINAVSKAIGWILNAGDLDGKVFEYEDAIQKAVFEIASKQKKYELIESKAFASKAALTTPNDVPISFYSANLDFTDWVLNNYNKKELPFGFRTNNWLALWSSNNKWNGKIDTAEKSRLEVFKNPSDGIRAALINIANKSILVKGKMDQPPFANLADLGSEPTIYDFIAKGHKSENVDSYMATFKKMLKWEKDHIINLKDGQMMADIVTVMAYHENGKDAKGNWLLDVYMPNKQLMSLVIQEGVNMYLNDTKWLDK